ncbi:lysoplasmalogenase [Treponema brennaborense]|uniref:YhhN family protein n=1 Tax=Treponema brennaborense (strain DSM 12168 / CIP 105900 / DD5/3) TaxID=906968 RepID=F4LKN8_TREBD|nr:lysoplasmalogenase [Treponema brennaborense]AEE15499.1 YhhN family protein [Treponema brennaborense DSM 12168]
MQNSYIAGFLLLPYAALSAFHLTACLRGKTAAADRSKCFLMPLLLLAYAGAAIVRGTAFHLLIAAALLFSTAGDYFLLDERTAARVRPGMIFFSCAQLCYAAAGAQLIRRNGLPPWLAATAAAVYTAGGACLYARLRNHIRQFGGMVLVYLVCISVMSWTFVTGAIAAPRASTVVSAAGSLLFVLSDSLLSKKMFIGEYPAARFKVMSTYLAAQLLIVGGSMFA